MTLRSRCGTTPGLIHDAFIYSSDEDFATATDIAAEQAILAAAGVALRSGITSVQTLLDTPWQMIGYARLRRANKQRLYSCTCVASLPPCRSNRLRGM